MKNAAAASVLTTVCGLSRVRFNVPLQGEAEAVVGQGASAAAAAAEVAADGGAAAAAAALAEGSRAEGEDREGPAPMEAE